MESSSKFFSFLLGSAIVHGLLVYLWVEKKKEILPVPPRSETQAIKTRLISPEELDARILQSRPTVETLPSNEKGLKDFRAHYRGERQQRVKKESVHPDFGSPDGAEASPAKKRSRPKVLLNEAGLEDRLGLSSGIHKSLESSKESSKALEQDSRIRKGNMNRLLKDVSVGAETVLNTDEYIYAGFFNRLKREVGPRWEPRIREILGRHSKKIASGIYFTESEFYLSSDGRVLRIEIKEGSGQQAFDQAAVASLDEIGKLANVPVDLLETSGQFRVELGFIVEVKKSGIRFNYLPDARVREGRSHL